jgi:hypothetical protein
MQRTFQTRIVAVLLALFTGAAIVCAGFNLVQETAISPPPMACGGSKPPED